MREEGQEQVGRVCDEGGVWKQRSIGEVVSDESVRTSRQSSADGRD